MDCLSCGAANDATARFCDQCGATLAAGCPSCGATNRPEARFCGTCGAALGAAPPAAARDSLAGGTSRVTTEVAERRLVSVLFADLVGFTPFAEERDPEEVRESLSRYFDRARDVIERHGGTVEKFIGDAVMAVWGTPVAHEDDAERAVRAGLQLGAAVRQLDSGLEARVGILTGEAAVNLAAAGEGMVAGDLVNTAARLQSVAPAGAVLVGEATMRAAGPIIAFEPVGEQDLKGKATPVAAWRALRVVAEQGSGGEVDLLEPPFVGRDEELALLKDLLHATHRDRKVRLVSVTGLAGIGKSRLATELGKYVDGLVEDVFWHRGRSPAYGEGITFWALGEMVRRRAGLAESDDEVTTRGALRTMLAEHVPDEVDRHWVEPAVLTLFGLEPPPAGGRDVLFAGWRILFERIAERGPTVLLFEDLHWADGGLLDFIDHLLASAKPSPILVVTLARPELFERRPDWLAGRRNVTGIALEPLPEPAMRELLAGLVPGLPEAAVRAVLDRADGIPMYAVETVRALVADGRLERSDGAYRPVGDLTELRVPESLQSLIASRLDALDPTDRRLLQDGSVLGQTFTSEALAAVAAMEPGEMESRLRGLVRRELLRLDMDPRSPERGQYGFVQSLVREVAYSTIARRDRRARHLAVARQYEALDDPELAGALATHYLAAHQASAEGPEADALAIQARRALRAAAERAIALGADREAVAYLGQALSITTADADRGQLLERAAYADGRAGRYEQAIAAGRSAVEAHEATGDIAAAARAAATLAVVQIDAAQMNEAEETIRTALSWLDGHPDHDDRATGALLETKWSRALMRLGRNDEAILAADRALAIAERDRLEAIVAEAFVNKGSSLTGLGRWREAAALLEAGGRLAVEIGDIDTEYRSRNNLASAIAFEEPARAESLQREVLALTRKLGNRVGAVWSVWVLCGSIWFTGDGWEEGIALIDETLAEDLSPSDRGRMLGARLSFMLDRGEIDEAMIAEQSEIAAELSDPEFVAASDTIAGQRAVIEGRLVEAYESYHRAASAGPQSRFWTYLEAASAALLLHDIDRVRRAATALGAEPDTGRFAEAARAWIAAGNDALEGRSTEAAATLRVVLSDLEAWPFFQAKVALTAVSLLPEAPDAPAWAALAREVFERCGARPWLAMLDRAADALPASDASPSARGLTDGDAPTRAGYQPAPTRAGEEPAPASASEG